MLQKMFVRSLTLLFALAPCAAARATQNELVPPTAGIFTGVQYSQKLGDAFRSLASCNKGPTAPANVGGTSVDGLCWIDDSVTPWVIKQYTNGGWAVMGALDPSTSSYAGIVGGGLGSVASATTTDLNLVPQANVTITGTATIGSFGSASPAGVVKFIRFAGALKLTNSSSLTVPGGFDLTTAANDRAIMTHLGSGNWEITQYTRANGIPVDVAAVGKVEFTQAVSIPPLHVAAYGQALSRATYPAYFARSTRTQNGTRTSGNATITAIADTTGLGAGMPVESTGVTPGCIIASVTSSSITLNSSSCVTSSGTSALLVLPYGYGTGGNYATDAAAPDCRGRTLAGRDRSDPGSLASRLTSSFFGADAGLFGSPGGGESKVLLTANLPPYTPSGGVINGAISLSGEVANSLGSPNNGLVTGPQTAASTFSGLIAAGQAASSFNGTAQGGTSTAFRTVQPTLIAECVVRVTP